MLLTAEYDGEAVHVPVQGGYRPRYDTAHGTLSHMPYHHATAAPDVHIPRSATQLEAAKFGDGGDARFSAAPPAMPPYHEQHKRAAEPPGYGHLPGHYTTGPGMHDFRRNFTHAAANLSTFSPYSVDSTVSQSNPRTIPMASPAMLPAPAVMNLPVVNG